MTDIKTIKHLTPHEFRTEKDRKLFEYAQYQIDNNQDLEFYRKKMNDGFVLGPDGIRQQINFK